MNREGRIIGYDVMRIVAATMVVCIHSNVYFLHKATGELHWVAVMVMTALCVVSVPLFFMVSGAGNLVKDRTTSFTSLFRIKIPKVFIPFVIWSLIYVCLRIAMGKTPLSVHSFISLMWEPAYYQFWFMYTLFGLYLCIPISQYIIAGSSKNLLRYILAFWAVSSLLLPVLVRYIPGFSLSGHFDLIFMEGYWGYFFLGGYLRKYPLDNERRTGSVLLAAGIVITVASAVFEWKFTPADRYYGYVYCAYLLPGAAMMATGAFTLLQSVHIKESMRRVIYYLSGLTMGVFYIHLIIINAYELAFKGVEPTFLNAVVKIMIVVSVSFAFCAALRHVRVLKRYLL